MSYFKPYIDATGIHTPTYSDILDKLLNDYRRIMGTDENGEDIYLGEDTQDYQWISIISSAFDDCMAALIDSYNARNPNYAHGASLDMILPVNGIKRNLATSSRAVLTITGRSGATLPANLQAKDSSGYLWRIPAPFTIPSGGSVQVDAVCISAGAIQADAGEISQIQTPIADWYSVTNAAPAIPGTDLESDASAKSRRAISVSLPSKSILDGIKAALQNIEGIGRTMVYENKSNVTDADGIPSHSICAVAESGNAISIAQAILLKKAPGVGTYGNEEVEVADGYGELNAVKFYRPVAADIYISITVKALSGWDSSMEASIKTALSNYAASVEIGGAYIVSYLWSLAFTVSSAGLPAFSVRVITAKKGVAGAETADTIQLAFNEAAFCTPEQVTVTVV